MGIVIKNTLVNYLTFFFFLISFEESHAVLKRNILQGEWGTGRDGLLCSVRTFFAIRNDELMANITLSLENASTLSQCSGEAIFYCSS